MIVHAAFHHNFYACRERLPGVGYKSGAKTTEVVCPYYATEAGVYYAGCLVLVYQLHVTVTAALPEIAEFGCNPHILRVGHSKERRDATVKLPDRDRAYGN